MRFVTRPPRSGRFFWHTQRFSDSVPYFLCLPSIKNIIYNTAHCTRSHTFVLYHAWLKKERERENFRLIFVPNTLDLFINMRYQIRRTIFLYNSKFYRACGIAYMLLKTQELCIWQALAYRLMKCLISVINCLMRVRLEWLKRREQ